MLWECNSQHQAGGSPAGTQAWHPAADATPWKRLRSFCPGCLRPWPASWVIASSHGGQQMCTAGGGAPGGIRPCPALAWARGAGDLGPGPRLHLYLMVWPWVRLWAPGASVSSASRGGGPAFFHQTLTEDPRCDPLCIKPRARARPSGPSHPGVCAPWGADIEPLQWFAGLWAIRGLHRKLLQLFPTSGHSRVVSDPRALWSECYDKAICLKLQSQRQVKAFPSFVPSTRLMGIGVWYAGVCVCVLPHLGGWGGEAASFLVF